MPPFHPSRQVRFGLLTLFAVSALCCGCSPGRLTERVEGIVTLDGKPLADIRVLFQPQEAEHRECGIGSYGLTDDQGHFVLRMSDNDALGAVVGLHSVTLSDKRTEDESDAGGLGKIAHSRIPITSSATPLTFRVKAGQPNVRRFDLSSH